MQKGRAEPEPRTLLDSGGKRLAHLKDNSTLNDLQRYLTEVCQERGWTKDSLVEKFVLFIEEVGKLAKAMRKAVGVECRCQVPAFYSGAI